MGANFHTIWSIGRYAEAPAIHCFATNILRQYSTQYARVRTEPLKVGALARLSETKIYKQPMCEGPPLAKLVEFIESQHSVIFLLT